MVLFCVALVALIAFVTLAVDIGRLRLARTELQNAADAAALASARSLANLPQAGSIAQIQDLAIDTAQENVSLDQTNGIGARQDREVLLDREEDIEFGIWRPSAADFFPLEYSGGKTDERREANAVRVWARRVTSFEKDGQTITRNTGVPLIFGPVIGKFAGEAQQQATVRLMGGRTGYGFVGLEWVKFNGTTKSDSYNSLTETYPGVGGANDLGTIASNGDITLVGNTEIHGDVHPGVEGSVQPYPLGGNVVVTGYMDPLEEPLVYPMPKFNPPTTVNPPNYGTIDPATALNTGSLAFAPKGGGTGGKTTIKTGKYLFSSWTGGSQDVIELDNKDGPIEIWVNGDVDNKAQAGVTILSDANPVTFWVNGNFKMDGGGITNAMTNPDASPPYIAKPSNLTIYITKEGTTVDIGGSPTCSAHIYAPGSEVRIHGDAKGAFGYWGSIIGKTLFVAGGSELHYDETNEMKEVPYSTHLVD